MQADEAQHGHYNDGHDLYASPPIAMKPCQSQRSRRYDSQHSVRYEHNQNSTNHDHDHHLPSASSFVSPCTIQDDYIPDANDTSPETNNARTSQRVPRRYKTLKKVELFHGNFVLDSAVPSKLLDMCALRTEREFTHMRYSAATCDPNDFKDAGFTLRQVHYDPPRRTELFIVMTMCDEDEELLCRSMQGVMKNIAHLCQRNRSKTWGKDAWKRVVVCIVSDGRHKINSRTLSVLATMGVYQEGIAKVRVFNMRSDYTNGGKGRCSWETRDSSHLRIYHSE